MKKTTFTFLLCISLLLGAQAQQETKSAYIIAYSEATSIYYPQVKYLLVTQYLIKSSNYEESGNGQAHKTFDRDLGLQYSDFIKKMNTSEGLPTYPEKFELVNWKIELVDKIMLNVSAGTTGSIYENIRKDDNYFDAAVKVRWNIINAYRKRGFVIRQVDFTPEQLNARGENWFIYNSQYGGQKNLNVSKTEPLLSWEVQVYQKGEILSAYNSAKKDKESDRKFKADSAKIAIDRQIKQAKLKSEIKSSYNYLKSLNPTAPENLSSIEGPAKSLVKQCNNFISEYGGDQEIEIIRNEANRWTQDGRIAFLADNADDVITGLAESHHFIFEYTQVIPENGSPKVGERIGVGLLFKDAFNSNSILRAWGLTFLRHPVRRFVRDYDNSTKVDTVRVEDMKSVTTGLRLGTSIKLNKRIYCNINADIHAALLSNNYEDKKEAPLLSPISVALDPRVGLGLRLGRGFEINAAVGITYAPLFLSQNSKYIKGNNTPLGNYTVTKYINGKDALSKNYTIGIRFGFFNND